MTNKKFSKIKINFIPLGKELEVTRIKANHRPEITKFNFCVINFGQIFKSVQNTTLAMAKRRQKSTADFRVLTFEKPEIKTILKTITNLGNTENCHNNEHRYQYQLALSKVYQTLVAESKKQSQGQTLGLFLERGSLLVGAFYHYPQDRVIRITAKRIAFANGDFGLGLTNLILPKRLSHFNKLHVQEDCIATGDSIAGTILALKKKGIFFTTVQIDVAVAVQTGVEFIMQFLRELGVEKVIIKTGALCFKMDDNFYLRRTTEEGYKNNEFFVGDMGEWSKILPPKFNKQAKWNKNRLDYKQKLNLDK